MSALAGHVSPPASTAPTHQNGTGQSAHGGDSKLNGGTHPAAAEAMSTQVSECKGAFCALYVASSRLEYMGMNVSEE